MDDHNYSVQEDKQLVNEEVIMHMEAFDRTLLDFMSDQKIPGASFALSHHGKIIYMQGYGVAGPGRLVTSTAMFRIASITKPITAMAVMKATEDEKLHLNQKVFGPNGILNHLQPTEAHSKLLKRVTVMDLLQHSGGWDRETDTDVVFLPLSEICSDMDPPLAYNEALAQHMMGRKLQFQPGKKHAYSNFGYMLLGYVLEKVSGMGYEDIVYSMLHNLDIGPLPTGHESRQLCDAMEVEYYETETKPVPHITLPGTTVCHAQYGWLRMRDAAAYGGLVASTLQLLHIFHQLDLSIPIKERILRADTIQQMLSRPRYEHGEDWYGLGLDIQDSGQCWGHSGSMDGSSGTFHRDKSGLSWVLLFNACSRDTDLDGLVKFGLSQIPSLPVYNRLATVVRPTDSEFVIASENKQQILQLMLPLDMQTSNHGRFTTLGYDLLSADILSFKNKFYLNLIWTTVNARQKISLMNWKVPVNEFLSLDNIFVEDVTQILRQDWRIIHISTAASAGHVLIVVVLCKTGNSRSVQKVTLGKEEKGMNSKSVNSSLVMQSVCVHCNIKYIVRVHEKGRHKRQSFTSTSHMNMSPDEFVKELRKYGLKKKGLMYCNFYTYDGKALVSAVWSKRQRYNCYQRYGSSIYGFSYEIMQSFENNIPLKMVSAYTVDGVLNFAGIWSAHKF